MANLQSQLKDVNDKLSDSETKLAEQQLVTKQIEAERDQKAKDVENLKQELQTKLKDVNDKVIEYEAKFTQHDSLIKQIESDRDQKAKELESLKQEHEAKLHEITNKLSESEQQLAKQQELFKQGEGDRDQKGQELESLKQDLQAKLNEVSAKLVESESKLAQQQSTVAQLESERDQKTKEVDALKQELKSLSDSAAANTTNGESSSTVQEELQARLSAESAKSAQLQDDLNKFQRDFGKINDTKTNYHLSNNLIAGVLKSKLEKVKQQILLEKQLRTELDLENTTFKGKSNYLVKYDSNGFLAMVDELEVKNKEYEKQIEELAKQKPVENGTAPTPAPSNDTDNSELAAHLKEMQELYDSESRRVQKLEEQNQALQNEVIDLQENQLRNLNVDNLQLKDQLSSAEAKVKDLTEKYEETNRIMEQLVANSEALEKDNKHLQKQNQSLTKQLHEAVRLNNNSANFVTN